MSVNKMRKKENGTRKNTIILHCGELKRKVHYEILKQWQNISLLMNTFKNSTKKFHLMVKCSKNV